MRNKVIQKNYMLQFIYILFIVLLTEISEISSTNYECLEVTTSKKTILYCDGTLDNSTCSAYFKSGIFISGYPLTPANKDDTVSIGDNDYSLWEYRPKVDGIVYQGDAVIESHGVGIMAQKGTTLSLEQHLFSCGDVTWRSLLYDTVISAPQEREYEQFYRIRNCQEQPNKTIVWEARDHHMWVSNNCAFREDHTYLSVTNVDLTLCIEHCVHDDACLDFTFIEGNCFKKKGPFNMTVEFESDSLLCMPNAICGWKGKQYQKQKPMPRHIGKGDSWWANGCEWIGGNDIETFRSTKEDCGEKCRKKEKSHGCSHFNFQDGKCYLLQNAQEVQSQPKGDTLCGYLDPGKDGKAGRGSSFCL